MNAQPSVAAATLRPLPPPAHPQLLAPATSVFARASCVKVKARNQSRYELEAIYGESVGIVAGSARRFSKR